MIADCNRRDTLFSKFDCRLSNETNMLIYDCCKQIGNKFHCKFCSKIFELRDFFYSHFLLVHGCTVINIFCEDCKLTFPYIADLKLHVDTVHKTIPSSKDSDKEYNSITSNNKNSFGKSQ